MGYSTYAVQHTLHTFNYIVAPRASNPHTNFIKSAWGRESFSFIVVEQSLGMAK